MVIGITGGIGSGKSLLGQFLKDAGYAVIDSDEVCREVEAKGTEGLRSIIEAFGTEYLTREGELDRKKLGALVFTDEESREKLNGIVHPLITAEVLSRVEAREGKAVFVEVPLLEESGLSGFFDEVWLVTADKKVRLGRIVLRDGVSVSEAERRMKCQISDAERIAAATRVLYNNGNIGDFKREAEKTLAEFVARA